jgi:hypothetical protein
MSSVSVRAKVSAQEDASGFTARFLERRGFLYAAGAIFLLLYLRRPDALNHPQFFAEDGVVFFHDQFLFGVLEALWIPHGGYLLFIQRLTAWLGSFFPSVLAPAIYNVTALALSAVCCAMFVRPVFRAIVRSDLLRFVIACLFAIALDSAELIGTITQIQWFLQIAGVLLLVRFFINGDKPHSGWRVLEALLLLLLALSCPLLVLAVPIALLLLVQRKAVIQSLVFLAGVAVQLVVYVQAGASRGQESVFQVRDLVSALFVYLGARPVLSSVIGRPLAMELCGKNTTVLYAALAGLPVLIGLGLLWLKANRGTQATILVCLYLALASGALALGARKMLRAEETITFGGERYFYLAACCFVMLAAIGIEVFLANLPDRSKSLLLVLLFAGGIWGNFKVPPFFPMHWELYQDLLHDWQRVMRSGQPVEAVTIPINPTGWFLTLEGNILSDSGFEDAAPFAWPPYDAAGIQTSPGHRFDPYHDAAIQMSRLHSFKGRASLRIDGQNGGAKQLVRNLEPGGRYRFRVMVFSECVLKANLVMILENLQQRRLASFNATPPVCGAWRPFEASFQAPREGAVWLKLGNAEGGLISYWDAVTLENGAVSQ